MLTVGSEVGGWSANMFAKRKVRNTTNNCEDRVFNSLARSSNNFSENASTPNKSVNSDHSYLSSSSSSLQLSLPLITCVNLGEKLTNRQPPIQGLMTG